MKNWIATYSVNPEIQQIPIQVMNYRQGSITALVNQDGTIAEKCSYDAWDPPLSEVFQNKN